MIGITVLGATGSVGLSTLDVLRRYPDRFQVIALTAHHNTELLYHQCLQWQPRYAVISDEVAAAGLRDRLTAADCLVEVLSGPAALEQVATLVEVDYVMAAIVGGAGLRSSLAAAQAGKRVLLANKEALVMAGALFMQAVAEQGADLLPIDSEHNALFQCLPLGFRQGLDTVGVTRLLLTASGGPFLDIPSKQLATVTPEQACAHPNWDMGRKISVDSATMMNKGLEVIEACCLFGAELNRVEVVIHPQSVVHSLVEYSDGSMLAQLGHPDMRTPIAHALAWPERISSGVEALDLCRISRLDFRPPDEQKFPCLTLAKEAQAAAGTAPVILNAANEVAVEAFLARRIRFSRIPDLITEMLTTIPVEEMISLEHVQANDAMVRQRSWQLVRRWARD